MTKNTFTKEQIEILASNPFTLCVDENQIRFTVEFKRFLLTEREKNGTPWKDIFRKAGYDPDMLGSRRVYSIIEKTKNQASSPKGLHETTSKRSITKDVERKHMKKAVQDLQKEVIHLQQQIEFLKKIQMLKVLEETED